QARVPQALNLKHTWCLSACGQKCSWARWSVSTWSPKNGFPALPRIPGRSFQVVHEPPPCWARRRGRLITGRHGQHEVRLHVEEHQTSCGDVCIHHVARHAAPPDAVLEKRVLGRKVRQPPSRRGKDAIVPASQQIRP